MALCGVVAWLADPSLGHAQPQAECLTTKQGGTLCAPPGGVIIRTEKGGVVCAPGHCERDRQGHMRCGSTANAVVTVTFSKEVQCQGGCVFPSPATCTTPGR